MCAAGAVFLAPVLYFTPAQAILIDFIGTPFFSTTLGSTQQAHPELTTDFNAGRYWFNLGNEFRYTPVGELEVRATAASAGDRAFVSPASGMGFGVGPSDFSNSQAQISGSEILRLDIRPFYNQNALPGWENWVNPNHIRLTSIKVDPFGSTSEVRITPYHCTGVRGDASDCESAATMQPTVTVNADETFTDVGLFGNLFQIQAAPDDNFLITGFGFSYYGPTPPPLPPEPAALDCAAGVLDASGSCVRIAENNPQNAIVTSDEYDIDESSGYEVDQTVFAGLDESEYIEINGFLDDGDTDLYRIALPSSEAQNIVLYMLLQPGAANGGRGAVGEASIELFDGAGNQFSFHGSEGGGGPDGQTDFTPLLGEAFGCDDCFSRYAGLDPNNDDRPSVIFNREVAGGVLQLRISDRTASGEAFGAYSFRIAKAPPAGHVFVPLPPAVWALGASLAVFSAMGAARRRAAVTGRIPRPCLKS